MCGFKNHPKCKTCQWWGTWENEEKRKQCSEMDTWTGEDEYCSNHSELEKITCQRTLTL